MVLLPLSCESIRGGGGGHPRALDAGLQCEGFDAGETCLRWGCNSTATGCTLPPAREKQLVIGVGFKKTGTTSLTIALNRLFRGPSCFARKVEDMLPVSRRGLATCYNTADGYFGQITTAAEVVEALELYPQAKFVLTVRDAQDWQRSVVMWTTTTKKYAKTMYQHALAGGQHKVDSPGYRDAFVARNQMVRDVFAAQNATHRLLELQFGHMHLANITRALCSFVDIDSTLDVCNQPFPHANANCFAANHTKKPILLTDAGERIDCANRGANNDILFGASENALADYKQDPQLTKVAHRLHLGRQTGGGLGI